MTVLKISHLNKRFGAVEATSDLSLKVEKGHIHGLIGPNGAGKTTFVNQLSGDIIPDSGTISFNGKDVTTLKPHRRTKLGIARSYQITSIFNELSVEENMALAILAHSGHNFRFWQNALKSRPVKSRLHKTLFYMGLDERSHIKAAHLSHGEKRQLEVGMALASNPKLLILDEPMAGMGPGGTNELSKRIMSLKGTLTILLVEHDMDVVFALADRITVLVNGSNLVTGTPDEIRRNEEVKAAYLGGN